MKDQAPPRKPVDHEWADYWSRLIRHTRGRYGRIRSRGDDPDDLAHAALVEAMESQESPLIASEEASSDDFFAFLCKLVRREFERCRYYRKRIISTDHESPSTPLQAGDVHPLVTLPSDRTEGLRHSHDGLQSASYSQITDKMCELVADDHLLVEIVMLWRSDPELRPRDLAEMLAVDIAEIQKAQKRLRRRLKVLREELKNG